MAMRGGAGAGLRAADAITYYPQSSSFIRIV